eukprot:7711599-Pyramimonas_sp.AAC.1
MDACRRIGRCWKNIRRPQRTRGADEPATPERTLWGTFGEAIRAGSPRGPPSSARAVLRSVEPPRSLPQTG